MKVKELIEKLNTFDENSIVVANIWEDEAVIRDVKTVNEDTRPYCRGDNVSFVEEIPVSNIVYLIG